MCHFRNLLFLPLLIGLILLSSCGKVVQKADDDKDLEWVDFSFSIPIVGSTNVDVTLSTSNETISSHSMSVTFLDAQVFSVVDGLKADGNVDQLSWGRADLSISSWLTITRNVTQNGQLSIISEDIPVWTSKAYRKDGVKLTKGNHAWTYAEFNSKTSRWHVESKKLDLGYPLYVTTFFTNKDTFFMKTVDQATVSGNPEVAFGVIDRYDTFLSIITLSIFRKHAELIANPDFFADLSKLYSVDFFNALSYQLPKNRVKTFSDTNPSFIWSNSLEDDLVAIYVLFDQNLDEVKRYVTNLEKPWLSPKARDILLNRLDVF